MAVVRRAPQEQDGMFLEKLAHEFDEAKKFAESATKRADELKKQLSAAVEASGDTDHKGNKWLSAGDYLLKRERRVSTTLDKSCVEEWAKSNGLWSAVSEVVETVVEDKVLALSFERPDLAPTISQFYTEKEIWAFKLSHESSSQ